MSDFVERRIKRVTFAAIGSLYCLAITWSISLFFTWLFLGAALYFGFLRIYFLRLAAPQSIQFSKSDSKMVAFPSFFKNRLFFILLMAIVVIILIALMFSKENTTSSSETTVQSLETTKENDEKSKLEIGIQFYQAQQYDSALKYYNAINQGDQDFKEALYNKTLVYYDQKDYSQAINIIKRCIQQFNDYSAAKQLLGDCYSIQEKQDSAIFYYQSAYKQGERNAQLCHWLGYLFDSKQDFEEAKKYYKEALNLDSSRVAIYERLASLEVNDSSRYLSLAKRWKTN